MSTFCILAAARATLTDAQALALRYSASIPLGTVPNGDLPAYRDPQGNTWLVVQEPRFRLLDTAVAARILANLAAFPDFDPAELSHAEIRAECERYADERGLVRPEEIDLGDDPWAAVLQANSAPPVIQVLGGIPDGWVPVEGD